MTSRALALIVGVVALCAFAAGWGARGHVRSTQKELPRPVASVDLPDAFWTEMETQRAMLRQLHDTCATKAAVAAAAAPAEIAKPAASAQAPPPPDDPVLTANAQSLVDRAIASGKWTDDDAAAMRVSMAAMTPGQRDDAMHMLLRALNERGVRRSTHGPVF
jgi:hypothetical protein